VELKIRIALQPKQTVFDRAVERYPKVFYGGAKGGGKSTGKRLIMLKRRLIYPGSTGYIFRKTYAELKANHIIPLLEGYPELRQFWHEGDRTLYLPNASKLCFAYIEHERQLQKFQGREMQDLAIEEAGDWPYSHYEYLEKQRRSSVVGIPVRTLLTGNPGGIGHAWLKRLFIDRRFEPGERPEDYHFVPALVEDNPALMAANPEYIRELESIKNEALRRAWRNGDWDIIAGQFFTSLSREIQLCKPFTIPDHWTRFGAYDYGFGHPASFGWYAVDGDGDVYKYRELVKARTQIKEFARLVNEHKDTRKLLVVWAGHDCWAKRNNPTGDEQHPPTVAEEFAAQRIFLKPAHIDRVHGARRLREYLEPFKDERGKVRSRLTIFETCRYTFDCLARMQHDPDNIEDVLKVDSELGDPETGDDPYDETRYAIMSRPALAKEPDRGRRDKYRRRPERRLSNWKTA
jgi:phage terminase large subunit